MRPSHLRPPRNRNQQTPLAPWSLCCHPFVGAPAMVTPICCPSQAQLQASTIW